MKAGPSGQQFVWNEHCPDSGSLSEWGCRSASFGKCSNARLVHSKHPSGSKCVWKTCTKKDPAACAHKKRKRNKLFTNFRAKPVDRRYQKSYNLVARELQAFSCVVKLLPVCLLLPQSPAVCTGACKTLHHPYTKAPAVPPAGALVYPGGKTTGLRQKSYFFAVLRQNVCF